MAFYFQRQSETVNAFYGDSSWRYYYDAYMVPGGQYFLDLSDLNSRDEVMAELESAEVLLFHATRNYRRPLKCRDGLIKSTDYPKGKVEIVLIHGQPETLEVSRTDEFIENKKKSLRFLVATPNQLNLFKNVELFPIVAQFTADDLNYQPRPEFLKAGHEVKILRRSEWKASAVAATLLRQIGLKGELSPGGGKQQLDLLLCKVLGRTTPRLLPKKIFQSEQEGVSITFDNRSFWQELYDVLSDLRSSDILLENDWNDYPGGGCNHTIGIEALSMGVACFNAMTKANAMKITEWLGADRLPPLPNWENEAHYWKGHQRYLHDLVFDQDFRLHLKDQSRQYFVDWYDAANVVPRITKQLEQVS